MRAALAGFGVALSQVRQESGGGGQSAHDMAILRGCASLIFGNVSVSTPSSTWALMCS